MSLYMAFYVPLAWFHKGQENKEKNVVKHKQ